MRRRAAEFFRPPGLNADELATQLLQRPGRSLFTRSGSKTGQPGASRAAASAPEVAPNRQN